MDWPVHAFSCREVLDKRLHDHRELSLGVLYVELFQGILGWVLGIVGNVGREGVCVGGGREWSGDDCSVLGFVDDNCVIRCCVE